MFFRSYIYVGTTSPVHPIFPNRYFPGFEDGLRKSLSEFRSNHKDFIFTRGLRGFKVIDPSPVLPNITGDFNIWGEDPVHPLTEGWSTSSRRNSWQRRLESELLWRRLLAASPRDREQTCRGQAGSRDPVCLPRGTALEAGVAAATTVATAAPATTAVAGAATAPGDAAV
jgi:hypothetical protein